MRILSRLLSAVLAASFAASLAAGAQETADTASVTTTDGVRINAGISEEMFLQDSSIYHHDIGMLTVALASSAYDNVDTKGQGAFIADAYKALGFPEDRTAFFSYSANPLNDLFGSKEMTSDSQAFSITSKVLGDITLLVVTIRGTDGTVSDDVSTDLLSAMAIPYLDGLCGAGFADFAGKIQRGFKSYTDNVPGIAEAADEDNLKIVVTGHSLGAAGANLFGAYLDSDRFSLGKTSEDDIYVYTYASPTTCARLPVDKPCRNIINMINRSDVVTTLPGNFMTDLDIETGEVGYMKGTWAGQNRLFDTHEEMSITNWSGHHPDRYIHRNEEDILPEDTPENLMVTGFSTPAAIFSANLIGYAKESDTELALQNMGDTGCIPDTLYAGNDCFFGCMEQNGERVLVGVLTDNSPAKESGYEAQFHDMQVSAEAKSGFDAAYSELDSYLSTLPGDAPERFFFTGTGTGGASAQLLAADMILSGKKAVCYSFGCGTTAEYSPEYAEQFSGLHSLINIGDYIHDTTLDEAESMLSRLGRTYLFNSGESRSPDAYRSILSTHDEDYLPPEVTGESIILCFDHDVKALVETDGEMNDQQVSLESGRELVGTPVVDNNGRTLVIMPPESTLRITGRTSVPLAFEEMTAADGQFQRYENIAMTAGRELIFSLNEEGAELVANNSQGEPEFTILPDGTEVKVKKSHGLVIAAVCAGGAIAAVALAVILLRRKKK